MVEELEQGRVRPVQVLEQEDERTLRGDGLEVASPRRERLLTARAGAVRRNTEQRREAGANPLLLRRLRHDALDAGCELCRCGVGFVRLENPRLGLHDLAQRPEGDPLAVREAAALAPVDEI